MTIKMLLTNNKCRMWILGVVTLDVLQLIYIGIFQKEVNSNTKVKAKNNIEIYGNVGTKN